MNKIQLCGMLLFCSNDTYFTAGSTQPPPPLHRGHLCQGGKREEWGRKAKKAKGVRRLRGGGVKEGE